MRSEQLLGQLEYINIRQRSGEILESPLFSSGLAMAENDVMLSSIVVYITWILLFEVLNVHMRMNRKTHHIDSLI